jgi:hypothetical protein
MMGSAVQIELANMVAVQCPHDADAREHRRATLRRHQDQGLHGASFLIDWPLTFAAWHAMLKQQ